jgi:hypothetical protein
LIVVGVVEGRKGIGDMLRRLVRWRASIGLEGHIIRAVLTLRFYEVSDEHQGVIEKAHWISLPILEQEFNP